MTVIGLLLLTVFAILGLIAVDNILIGLHRIADALENQNG